MPKLYAIRDRLIGWYMLPFAAQSDKQVLASLATTINTGDPNSAIAQAPHHFEIWQLAEIDEETGDCKPARNFIADASSLVRTDLRRTPGPGETGARTPAGDRQGPAGDGQGGAGETRAPVQSAPGAPRIPPHAGNTRPAGSDRPAHHSER